MNGGQVWMKFSIQINQNISKNNTITDSGILIREVYFLIDGLKQLTRILTRISYGAANSTTAIN